MTASHILLDAAKERAILVFPRAIPAGTDGVLHLEFRGTLSEDSTGFYRSPYKDAQGNTVYVAATQFEPHYARRAFPCWDEPALKATFSLTLQAPCHLTTLSNTPAVSETASDGAGYKMVKFATTPVMSTYLVAVVVGELEYLEAFTQEAHGHQPVACRVYATPGNVKGYRWALSVATRALDLYKNVLGIPYPLPKMDIANVPNHGSAMENWGLVIAGLDRLYYDEKWMSLGTKETAAHIIAHELAHYWAGNLVTMEWWTDLWLNEGFATWISTLALELLFPEFDAWAIFQSGQIQLAMCADALSSSAPIQTEERDLGKPDGGSKAVIYAKGASVLRMLRASLGLEPLLKAIALYLKEHAYSSATTQDFCKALCAVAGEDAAQMADKWTRQAGFPVVTVTENPEKPGSIHVKQSRFLFLEDVQADNKDLWPLPLAILTSKGVLNATLSGRETTVVLPEDYQFYKLNADQACFFHTKYPTAALESLGKLVAKSAYNNKPLSVQDRAGLLFEAHALAKAGHVRTSSVLSLLQCYSHEQSFFVLDQLAQTIAKVAKVWKQAVPGMVEHLHQLILQIYYPLVERYGWDYSTGDSGESGRLRSLAITECLSAHHTQVVAEATQRFWRFAEGNAGALHPQLRPTVFNTVASLGGAKEYEALLKLYRSAYSLDTKLAAGQALGRTRVPTLLQRTLELASSSEVRLQEAPRLLAAMENNDVAGKILWQWLTDQWPELCERFSNSPKDFGRILNQVLGHFQSEADLAKAEVFLAARDISAESVAYHHALEEIQVRSSWIQRDLQDVQSWANHLAILLAKPKPGPALASKARRVDTQAMRNYVILGVCLVVCFKLLSTAFSGQLLG